MSPEVKTPQLGVFWRGQMRGDSEDTEKAERERGPWAGTGSGLDPWTVRQTYMEDIFVS